MHAHFDVELARRYSIAGPRYTSYPTANHFHSDFGEANYRQSIAQSNSDPIPKPLSLYVHVPFCESPCFYCGCTRIITLDHSRGERYLLALQKEIVLQAACFDADRIVTQMHFGGGTPTFLSDAQLESLLAFSAEHFAFAKSDSRELAIEVDPRTVTPERILELKQIGFNRISLGIQDFNFEVQSAINRIQSFEHTEAIINAARMAGFQSINVDLIYGLPKQHIAGFERTLQQVISLRPDRIAAYGYAHLPNLFRAQKQISDAALPDAESKLRLLACTVEQLIGAGYDYIGMDHFALPSDALSRAAKDGSLRRNFQGYSTQAACDIVGLGVSAISAVANCYAQNEKLLDAYYDRVENGHFAVVRGIELNEEDLLRRTVIERLLCHGRIDFSWFLAHFDQPFKELFAAELGRLTALIEDGLVRVSERALELTAVGRFLMRAPAMCFDAYLNQATLQESRFSKII